MNNIKSLSLKLTIGFIFGISIVSFAGCQHPSPKSQSHEPSTEISATVPKSSQADEITSSVAVVPKISYQSTETGDVTREFKSDVRGLRGLRGLRGTCKQVKDDFALRLLVPKHAGRTLEAQPTLYWWVSQPLSDAEFTFILDKVPNTDDLEFSDPLIETTLNMSVSAGIQALPFSKVLSPEQANFDLEKDVEYQWTLLITCHPDFPSLDINATGTIRRIGPSTKLKNALETATDEELPYLYAKQGIWYDAMNTLSVQIQKQPKLHTVRADLLEQVGLQKVADYERQNF